MNKNELIRKIEELLGNSGVKVTLYSKGMKPTNDSEKCFVDNSNKKYFEKSSDALLGDFITIHTRENSFLRYSVEELLHLNEVYGWNDVVNHIMSDLEYSGLIDDKVNQIVTNLNDYEFMKEFLIVRPLNNHNLDGAVYKELGDIALVLYAFINDTKESLNTLKIPYDVFVSWNVSVEDVFEKAMNNTVARYEATFYKDPYDAICDKPIDIEKFQKPTDYLMLTTSRKTNGAIALFYPNVKEKIAKLLDSDYYIVFTSINEAVIHRKDSVNLHTIRTSLYNTNNEFDDSETLSRLVYIYNRETGKLNIA